MQTIFRGWEGDLRTVMLVLKQFLGAQESEVAGDHD